MNLRNSWNGNRLYWNNVGIVIIDGQHTTTNEWLPNHWWCRRIDDKIVLMYIVHDCGRFKRVDDQESRQPADYMGSAHVGPSVWWIVRLLDTHRWRTRSRASVRVSVSVPCWDWVFFLLYIWTFYVLIFHASLQSNFIWNILQGIRQAGLPVSEWVTFLFPILLDFAFHHFVSRSCRIILSLVLHQLIRELRRTRRDDNNVKRRQLHHVEKLFAYLTASTKFSVLSFKNVIGII